MRIPLSVRFRSLFAKDKEAFWWHEITDEEKQLRRMDAWQLAAVIQEANVRIDTGQKRIVAEHMLNVRLAKIQAMPAYLAVCAGIAGVIGGAFLTAALQPSQEHSKCVSECQHGESVQQNKPQPKKSETPVSRLLDVPKNERVQDASKNSEKYKP